MEILEHDAKGEEDRVCLECGRMGCWMTDGKVEDGEMFITCKCGNAIAIRRKMEMREIKFRAWDPIHKRMFDCDIISDDRGYEHWQYFEDGNPYSNILMQFTGLKDKNGKEIYEGDAVKFWSNELIGFIYWSESTARFEISQGHFNIVDISKSEIIGNIYENPELLKEKKK